MELNDSLIRRFHQEAREDDAASDMETSHKPRVTLSSHPSVVTTCTMATEYLDDRTSSKPANEELLVLLSGLYGIFLVVLGLVLPITEAMCNARSLSALRFELFYVYLYLVSIMFLAYVYTFLLRKDGLSLAAFSVKFSRSSRSRQISQNSETPDTALDTSSYHPSTTSAGKSRNTKIAFISKPTNHTGSFYLRVGAVGFGVGAMIHSAVMFGHFLEMALYRHPCSDVYRALKPFVHMCFTFSQMYFIFRNSKMAIHKYQILARFGLMHMCGTNICVWLRSIVVETLHVMNRNERKHHDGGPWSDHGVDGPGVPESDLNRTKVVAYYNYDEMEGNLPELKCQSDSVMGRLLESSSTYLYPCTIQYSLICAGVLYVMWYNVGVGRKLTKNTIYDNTSTQNGMDSDDDDNDTRRTNRISVDCASSSQGLFLGMAVLVGALCCLIWFYVIIGNSDRHLDAGSLLGHLTEDFIYVVTLLATLIAAFQMKDMRFSLGLHSGIDEILTLVSLGGLGLFGVFSIVASMFYLDTMDGKLTVLTNVAMLVQASSQATFILTCLNVSATNHSQANHKPGRNCVTFLLVSNFTLWIFNTFETQSPEHNLVQVEFYGPNAWSIFSHISVPLGIYYRFHSTVCLSTIWKCAWKTNLAARGLD